MPSSITPEPKSVEPESRLKWDPDFFRLPIHSRISWEMDVCMEGIQSSAVFGPAGVGKSYSITKLKEAFDAEETARAFDSSDPDSVRQILHYESSKADGKMTALVDLYHQLSTEPIPSRGRQGITPTFLVSLIAKLLRRESYRLVCIDEAQKIDVENIKLLRQVRDGAAAIGHPMGIIYIGLETLRDKLVSAGELGQRVGTEIHFPLVSRSTLAPHWHAFHPDLASLRDSMSKKEWSRLEKDFFDAANGKFRRLHTMILNANALAGRLKRPMDEEILRAAINKLAPEV